MLDLRVRAASDAGRKGGRAEDDLSVAHVIEDSGARGDDGSSADAEVSRDARLTGDRRVRSDLDRARQTGLRDEEDVGTDPTVVSDHHEVVDLRAASDDSRIERAAVDRR